MRLDLSKFGSRFCGHTGILALMDDLGEAMAGMRSAMMLGGGNPAAVPRAQAVWRRRMGEILADPDRFDRMLCNYDVPQGRPALIRAVSKFFRATYGWDIGPENVAVTNGSQAAFFYLFNMLGGEFTDGRSKHILIPLMPEYIGYADQGLADGMFVSAKPSIEFLDAHTFKYHVDFDHLEVGPDVAAIALSRPTNPTGNVVTDRELMRLAVLAKTREIPLLIDNAYGAPFPRILFTDVTPIWDEHIIVSLSLSKLGLPGARTGIIIAAPEVTRAVSAINAIAGLATGNIGPEIVASLVETGEIVDLCKDAITPFYAERKERANAWLREFIGDELPVYAHICEGAMFLWVWCKDLPISSRELYDRLKNRNVIVVPGHHFFYGLGEDWPHAHECLRINYSQPEDVVREGLRIVADEIRKAYEE